MFYQKMVDTKRRLEMQIDEIERKMQKLPKNNFYCIKEGSHWKWYYLVNGRLVYISKENDHMAKQLAVYKYYKRRLQDLKRELAPVDAYLRKYNADKDSAGALLCEQSGYMHLLQDVVLPKDMTLQRWMKEDFLQNSLHPENKIYKVSASLSVRSKSEALIASQLMYYQIPFRYECALQLQDGIIYPDFTLRHPVTGEIYYWEHLGLLEQKEYRLRTAAKIKHYIESGVVPGEKLIITVEHPDQPLSLMHVTDILTMYFM